MSAAVRELIRLHPHERLYVKPGEWTARHVELLQCTYELAPALATNGLAHHGNEKQGIDDGNDSDKENQNDGSKWAMLSPSMHHRFAATAERFANGDNKNIQIKTLLTEPEGPFMLRRPSGFFYYGNREQVRLHGYVFHLRKPETESRSPSVVFLQKSMIKIQREQLFPSRYSKVKSPQTTTIREMQLKQITPPFAHLDPYILAALVGMVQSQMSEEKTKFNEMMASSDSKKHIFQTNAVYVDNDDENRFWLYTANISAEYLSKFAFPPDLAKLSRKKDPSSLRIKYKSMSFKPYSTLRKRLLEEILPTRRA